MSLSLMKLVELEQKGLTTFFEENRDTWRRQAEAAFDSAKSVIDLSREPVRQDDVVALLTPVVAVSPDLNQFLVTRRLTQRVWYQYFAELIVDRLWDGLKERGA